MYGIWFILLILLTGLSAACWKPEVEARQTAASSETNTRSAPNESSRPENSSVNVRSRETPNADTSRRTVKNLFQSSLPTAFQMPGDEVGKRLLVEYGSLFVAGRDVLIPDKVLFRDESEVSSFHARLEKASENIGGFDLELQAAAMRALRDAIAEAQRAGLSITPRSADSAKRTYTQTVELWASRVNPGLDHWVSRGRLDRTEADRIRALPPAEQVAEILKLEARGLYFSKDFSKSILYSVAAPGASQHIFMLAFDVKEFSSREVREILARHGWFQTVQSDLPHFTYLGVPESELPAKGLRAVFAGGQKFWIPDLQGQ